MKSSALSHRSLRLCGETPRDDDRGFTLIELLVASVIVAVIASAVYGALRAGIGATRRGERESEIRQIGREALEFVAQDIRSTYSSGSVFDTGLLGEDESEDERATDSIRFLTCANFPSPYSEQEIDIVEAEYFVGSASNGYDPGLYRKVRTLLTGLYTSEDDEYAETWLLLDEVTQLDFKYYNGAEWSDSWDSLEVLALPSAVQVSIAVRLGERDEEERIFSTIVFLPLKKDLAAQGTAGSSQE